MAAEMVPPAPMPVPGPSKPRPRRYRFTLVVRGEEVTIDAETCVEEGGLLVLRTQGEVVRQEPGEDVDSVTSVPLP